MCSLQLPNCRGFEQSESAAAAVSPIRREPWRSSFAVIRSSFWGVGLECMFDDASRRRLPVRRSSMIFSPPCAELNLNLSVYMLYLEKPLGIRFALSVDGQVFVYALQRGGNAERSKMIMVGDTLKKAGRSSKNLVEIKDLDDTESLTKGDSGSCLLLLERPSNPFPIHHLYVMDDTNILFNRGRAPIATWNKRMQASNLQDSSESNGKSGFVVFSQKFLTSQGWKSLDDLNKTEQPQAFSPPVAISAVEESDDAEWGYGSFPPEECVGALDRSKGELYYDHSLGIRYSKITKQIYVGSCIKTKEDVETLAAEGITVVLNFQSMDEAAHWGLDLNSVNELCRKANILMINFPDNPPIDERRAWPGQDLTWPSKDRAWAVPGSHAPAEMSTIYSIRDGDSFDLRKKLPFCVGVLLRLLKKNHRVYVTCTTGFDRSPACVIAYLHWVTDISLYEAYNFVTGLHPCRPNRPAIVCATWDLIALAENGTHDGPETHVVTFVWIGLPRQEVYLVGDFDDWTEPIKAIYKGGPRYEAEVRLPQGKYYYKFKINGQWKCSKASPIEGDETVAVSNVIVVGDIASAKPTLSEPQEKDASIVKVIERPLTEHERFMLAKAARCVAFRVSPTTLAPK